MSHWFKVKTKLNSVNAIKAAAGQLGHMVVHNRMCRGYREQQTPCDLVMKLPGEYDLGFQKQQDGSYEIIADFWSDYISKFLANPEVAKKAYENYHRQIQNAELGIQEAESLLNEAKISKFMQMYNQAALEELIQQQGLQYIANTLADGTVVYETISPDDTDQRVKTTIDPVGNLKVEAEGFTGSSCTAATAFLKNLGVVDAQETKPEYYIKEEPLKEKHHG